MSGWCGMLVRCLALACFVFVAACSDSAFSERAEHVAVSLQQADAGALAALADAGCLVQSHEFTPETQGHIVATDPSGQTVKVSMQAEPQGGVMLRAWASGGSEQESLASAERLMQAVTQAALASTAK